MPRRIIAAAILLAFVGGCVGGDEGSDLGTTDEAGGACGSLPDPCSPHATCDDTGGTATCTCGPGYSGNGRTCIDLSGEVSATTHVIPEPGTPAELAPASVLALATSGFGTSDANADVPLVSGRNVLMGINAAGRLTALAVWYPAAGDPPLELGPESTVVALVLMRLGRVTDDTLTSRLVEDWIRAQPEVHDGAVAVTATVLAAGALDIGSPQAAPLSVAVDALTYRLLDTATQRIDDSVASTLEVQELGYLSNKGIRLDWERGESCTKGRLVFQNPNNHYTLVKVSTPQGAPTLSPYGHDYRLLAPFQPVPDVSVVDVLDRIAAYAKSLWTLNADAVAFAPTETDAIFPATPTEVGFHAKDNDKIPLLANVLTGVLKVVPIPGKDCLFDAEDAVGVVLDEASFLNAITAYETDKDVRKFFSDTWGPLVRFALTKIEKCAREKLFDMAAESALEDLGSIATALPDALLATFRLEDTLAFLGSDEKDPRVVVGSTLFPDTCYPSEPTCSDLVQNQGESDIDCGGPCTDCPTGRRCVVQDDCASSLCDQGHCRAPCAADECGGVCPACPDGYDCVLDRCQLQPQQCPNAKDCTDRQCGDDPICNLSCGTCKNGESCQEAKCVAGPCEPQCSGRLCGDDGCGGSCGDCPWGIACTGGVCTPPTCGDACQNTTCRSLFDCRWLCADDACKVACQSNASIGALDMMRTARACSATACPSCTLPTPTPAQKADCDSCFGRAAFGACLAQWRDCIPLGVGNCLQFHQCGGACSGNMTCLLACMGEASARAQALHWDIMECMTVACPSTTPEADLPNCLAAAAEAGCKVPFDACVADGVAELGTFTPSASMSSARSFAASAVLPDGRVLVVGGAGPSNVLTTSEAFDPARNEWQPAVNLVHGRLFHSATPLLDGRVLVAGGWDTKDISTTTALSQAEVLGGTPSTWSDVAAMSTGRGWHSAVRLNDGRVLLADGHTGGSQGGLLTHGDCYDPTTNSWTMTEELVHPRHAACAVVLPDGRVLLAGGVGIDTPGTPSVTLAATEIYDPATNAWSPSIPMSRAHGRPTCMTLSNGDVVVIGGETSGDLQGATMATVEVFKPSRGTWWASDLATPRIGAGAVELPDGRILVAGGMTGTNETGVYVNSTEVFSPVFGFTTPGPDMISNRFSFVLAPLAGNRFLAAGGRGGEVSGATDGLATTEILSAH